MEILDRVALVVRPKRRYVEWANRLQPGGAALTLDNVRAEPVTYLVAPDTDEDGHVDVQGLIDRWASQVFDDQLQQWTNDQAAWPSNRTPHLFRDWFDVEMSELVADLDDDLPMFEDPGEFTSDEARARCGWCLGEIDPEADPLALTMPVAADEPLEIPEGTAVPWPVPAPHGFALVTAPEDDVDSDPGFSRVTFHICSEACAEALRDAVSSVAPLPPADPSGSPST